MTRPHPDFALPHVAPNRGDSAPTAPTPFAPAPSKWADDEVAPVVEVVDAVSALKRALHRPPGTPPPIYRWD
jgi:hypothetical protein